VLELADIVSARQRIAGRVHRTPTFPARTLGEMGGVRLHLKAELFQKTGSFKPRGVFNKLLSMSDDERSRGLVSISAGNHAAALAFGSSSLGARATIVMRASAVRSKVEATRAYGGEVILTEQPLMDVCREIQEVQGLILVHPFDDPALIAGQGTVGLEVLEDVPDLDTVIVPVGGGGLIAGIATAVKASRSEAKVIGVEPEEADAMTRALEAGEPVDIGHPTSVADGLSPPFAGRHTLPVVQRLVDEVVLVSEEDIIQATRLVMERCKLAAEPAGVAGVAALLSGAAQIERDSRVVCVITGGNVDLDRLAQIL